tara:strand:- start:1550 stop:1921 length:372 start_codon:yes stop_codon:yes gene_type:complete
MLKGFEDITYELTKEEMEKLPIVIKGLERKIGKGKAVTSTKICEALNLKAPRLRKIINHIRINNLIFGLCSSSNGYFIADNEKELNEYIISLKQRIKAQVDVLNALEKQTLMFGGTGQTTLFE